ncbi:hypothetical protein [Mixta calida]|uniref:hypothetical protein n=1 Tax=Mixta calida TaxID=665913 RepID=UPI00290C1E26|nr:hypothetical protein [Mixta calida]MDU6413458.1 hypothetical protein [Mixta calida]
MSIKTPSGETLITWQMLLVIFATSFGIYLGGVSSGYFIARAEYAQKAQQRDVTVNEIKKKVDQLPQQTASEVKEAVKSEEGK